MRMRNTPSTGHPDLQIMASSLRLAAILDPRALYYWGHWVLWNVSGCFRQVWVWT